MAIGNAKMALQVRSELSLLKIDAMQRRMIAVVEEEELPEILTRTNDDQDDGSLRRFKDLFRHLTLSFRDSLQISIDVIDATIKLQRILRSKGTDILPVSPSSLKDIVFPPGHPRAATVYVVHPTKLNVYYPVADFHRLNFETKVNEATRMLMALGANSFSVNRVAGWSRDFAAQMGINLSEGESGAQTKSTEKESKNVIFTAELAGSDKPVLPADLVWYDYEPTWQTVAEGRLKHGLTDFNISITYNDDFGVNAALEANIKSAGLKLSGSFAEHTSTVWTMSGKFGERS